MSKYTVRHYQDDEYEIVNEYGVQLYKGNIVEVNAWLEMAEKGYEL